MQQESRTSRPCCTQALWSSQLKFALARHGLGVSTSHHQQNTSVTGIPLDTIGTLKTGRPQRDLRPFSCHIQQQGDISMIMMVSAPRPGF
ncbi:hypothetical protein BaRGS_00004473 [Batillaria attramentaria]|uniref:Uncharacterized protein n=1 Tax=Batillaria attramentaria TaxID=370345 RepID=A0ABD0LX09_9CAEN